ncbi:MAG: hypothetical protein ABUL65_00425 [Opitutus sp.]
MQQLRHALARGGNVCRFLRRFGLDRFSERSGLVARKDHGELLWEFGFELREHIGASKSGGLEIAGAAQGRAKAAAFVPASRDEIAGFDFHVHEEIRESSRLQRWLVA